jgi:hypothetical protein
MKKSRRGNIVSPLSALSPAARATRERFAKAPPIFHVGQRVFIDTLKETGKISAVLGFAPFVGANVYEIALDSSGNEVQWTEGHLSTVEDE